MKITKNQVACCFIRIIPKRTWHSAKNESKSWKVSKAAIIRRKLNRFLSRNKESVVILSLTVRT
ncbi:hypothetical protein BDF21DRAFT_427215 [Thamnidium elegans]|nr:hypothetical protein BDF21DRAFT_427215 [Thamnidium elegans]